VRIVSAEGPGGIWPPGGYGSPAGPGASPARGRLRTERRADAGVAANARLTASNAAVLLVLLAAEAITLLRVRQLLSPHVFIGTVLIPPVLLKVASTTWRFARYYRGAPAYRRKGPPPLLLRRFAAMAHRGQPGSRRPARVPPAQPHGPLAGSGARRRSLALGRRLYIS